MRHRRWIACLVLGIVLAGCEHADPLTGDTGGATLSSIQANIFDTHCALSGCHIGGSSSLPGSLNLRAGEAYSNIVGVSSVEQPALRRIDPGNPDNSYLVHKIQGEPGISGSRMPFGRPALSQEQIDLIREWVANGAMDN